MPQTLINGENRALGGSIADMSLYGAQAPIGASFAEEGVYVPAETTPSALAGAVGRSAAPADALHAPGSSTSALAPPDDASPTGGGAVQLPPLLSLQSSAVSAPQPTDGAPAEQGAGTLAPMSIASQFAPVAAAQGESVPQFPAAAAMGDGPLVGGGSLTGGAPSAQPVQLDVSPATSAALAGLAGALPGASGPAAVVHDLAPLAAPLTDALTLPVLTSLGSIDAGVAPALLENAVTATGAAAETTEAGVAGTGAIVSGLTAPALSSVSDVANTAVTAASPDLGTAPGAVADAGAAAIATAATTPVVATTEAASATVATVAAAAPTAVVPVAAAATGATADAGAVAGGLTAAPLKVASDVAETAVTAAAPVVNAAPPPPATAEPSALAGVTGTDPAGGVATLVEMVKAADTFDLSQAAPDSGSKAGSIVDALALDDGAAGLLGDAAPAGGAKTDDDDGPLGVVGGL